LIYRRLVSTRILRVPSPFDLRRTARAAALVHIEGDASAWYAAQTADGPATVEITRSESGVDVSAWGPGGDLLLEQAPRLLGLDDDPDAFDPGAGLLRDLHRRFRGLRLGSTGRIFEALIPTVIGQLVTSTEA
jgi:3-methyladenine DNA glycosylase/8-oxoguanine DNA glycosylase